jgi:hypothetical protein
MGAWEATGNLPGGSSFRSTMSIDERGDYVAHVVVEGQSGIRTADMEGRLQVKDGMLFDTMTKHSNTNAVLPRTDRSRIVRMSGRETVIHWESNQDMVVPTNDVVFRRVEK